MLKNNYEDQCVWPVRCIAVLLVWFFSLKECNFKKMLNTEITSFIFTGILFLSPFPLEKNNTTTHFA